MLRLIQDGVQEGAVNMARDEAMMEAVGKGEAPPTVRLYGWCEPTISLGYFQHFSEYQALPPPAGALSVVRRLTGGGAILHDLELTYSIALPMGHELLGRGARRLYELAHDAVMAALARLDLAARRCGESDDSGAARGPFFCFERRHCYDVLVGAEKIAGSAQRRTRHAVLQHGSIVLGNRFGQQRTAQATRGEPLEAAARGVAQVRESLPKELEKVMGLTISPSEWTRNEQDQWPGLVEKYQGPAWTRRM